MQIKEYWQRVQAQRDLLPEVGYIVSIGNAINSTEGASRPGVLVEADRDTAARCLASGTHRLAMEDEIERYHKGQQEQSIAQQAAAERAKQGIDVVKLVEHIMKQGQRPKEAK